MYRETRKNVIARQSLHLCRVKRNTKMSMPDIIMSDSESNSLNADDTLFCQTEQLGVGRAFCRQAGSDQINNDAATRQSAGVGGPRRQHQVLQHHRQAERGDEGR